MFIGIGMDLCRGGGSGFFSGATLDMNFAAGAYLGKTPAAMTVSRTGTTNYAETSTGTLTAFAINTARITDKGLLVEEARTNLCLQSQTFGTTWTTAAASVTADQTTAPDGTLTADLITTDGTTAAHGVNQTITAASNVARVASVYYKPNGWTWIRLFYDDGGGANFNQCYFNCSGAGAVGTAANGGTGSGAVGSIQALANGWYRCSLAGTNSSADSTSNRFLIRPTTGDGVASPVGDSVSGGYVWGAQLEAGAFVTSYIPTTTGSQTRVFDQVGLTSTAFTDIYASSTTGTLYVETIIMTGGSASGTNKYHAAISDTSLNNRVALFTSTTGANVSFRITSGAATNFTVDSAGAAGDGVIQKLAIAWDNAGTGNAAKNGSLIGADDATVTAPVTPTRLSFGGNEAGNGVAINGFVRRIAFIPSRVSNATIQAMTT